MVGYFGNNFFLLTYALTFDPLLALYHEGDHLILRMCSLFIYLTHISYLFVFVEMEGRKRDRGLSSNEKHLFGHHSYKQTTLRETYKWLS